MLLISVIEQGKYGVANMGRGHRRDAKPKVELVKYLCCC